MRKKEALPPACRSLVHDALSSVLVWCFLALILFAADVLVLVFSRGFVFC